jgi:diacylglycerol kinase (ATP)
MTANFFNHMVPETLESDNKPRIGVLINPLGGKNRRISGSLVQTINEYSQVLQQKVQTPQDVYDTLIEFGRRKVNILVISGGDGTVQAVLTVLLHHRPFVTQPQLIVLEGGTTNMIAGDVGVSGNQVKALRRLFKWMQTGSGSVTRIQRSVLRLHVPGHEVKYGMFFGAAGISQGIQYYRKNLHNNRLHGFPGICMTFVRFLWGIFSQHKQFAVSTHITLSLDRQPVQKEDFMLLFVSTLDRLFFGLRPFWGSENGPLRFTAVRSRARYLWRVLPFLARGRSTRKGSAENGYYSRNAHNIELYIEDSVALDGEIYTPESGQKPTSLQSGGNVTFLRVHHHGSPVKIS